MYLLFLKIKKAIISVPGLYSKRHCFQDTGLFKKLTEADLDLKVELCCAATHRKWLKKMVSFISVPL